MILSWSHAGSTALTNRQVRWGAKAKPPVLSLSGGFAVRDMRLAIHIQKIAARRFDRDQRITVIRSVASKLAALFPASRRRRTCSDGRRKVPSAGSLTLRPSFWSSRKCFLRRGVPRLLRVEKITERKNIAMYDTSTERREQSDEEALNFDISDTALEASAGEVKHKAASQTIAFCSGIDTCPS